MMGHRSKAPTPNSEFNWSARETALVGLIGDTVGDFMAKNVLRRIEELEAKLARVEQLNKLYSASGIVRKSEPEYIGFESGDD